MKQSIAVASMLIAAAWVTDTHADSTALTWNRVALEAVERAKPNQHQTARLLTHVSLAQYAAIAQAGSEDAARDAIAIASARVIAALLPAQASFVEERRRQLQAGDSVEGSRAAERVLAAADTDGFAQKWTGETPQGENAWRSLAIPPAPPAYPAFGALRTYFLEFGGAVRPAGPPALGSQRFLDDLAEVRRYTQSPTPDTVRIARFYEMTTGTLAAGYWNEQAAELVRASAMTERQASTVLVTVNAAIMDALAACHDAKYVYWVPRPSQADPAIKPLIGVPNHPSYASNHACLSTAAGLALAHFFPREGERLRGIAAEAGLSRIYAGIHYRFDVEAGEEIGRKVAAAAASRHADMLARWTRVVVGAND